MRASGLVLYCLRPEFKLRSRIAPKFLFRFGNGENFASLCKLPGTSNKVSMQMLGSSKFMLYFLGQAISVLEAVFVDRLIGKTIKGVPILFKG